MNILSRSSFDRSFRKLTPQLQREVRAATARLPGSFGNPHIHAGLGIRRVGQYFEFRIGLKLRVLFYIPDEDIVLLTVGDHDEIRRFVRDIS